MKYIDDTNSESKLQVQTPNTNNTRKMIEKQKQNQQEDLLRKVKDDKETILRNSLRNSEKLKKLEKVKQEKVEEEEQTRDIGNVNIGFINDDDLDNSDIDHIGTSESSPEENNSSDSEEKNKFYKMDTIDSGNVKDLKYEDLTKLSKTLDITDLFSQVDYIQTKLQQSENKSINDDILLLRKLYKTSEFQNALVLYNKLVNLNTIKRIKPLCDNTYNLADEVSTKKKSKGKERERAYLFEDLLF
jgi:hypothetical protein